MKKETFIGLIALVATALTACTPEQIATYERLSGTNVAAATEKALLPAPDADFMSPWGVIHADGSVTKYVAPSGSRCPQHYAAAIRAGWPEKEWSRLDYVMYRESRCDPKAWNKADPGTGSRGLTQINSFWCTPNTNNPTGWLQAQGVLTSCDQLFDPFVSLRASRVIWGRSGWSPWGL